MSQPRHKKSRRIRAVGVTTAVVGAAGAAFVLGPLAGNGSADPGAPAAGSTALAFTSTWLEPRTEAAASKTTAATSRHPRKHWHPGHGPGHRRPTPRPTTPAPTTPTAAPTTPTAAPTTPTAAPTTPTAAPTTAPPTTAPTTTPPAAPTTTPPAAPTTTPPAAPTTTAPPAGTPTQQYQTEVIRLVNVERAKVGCNALTANSALTNAAQAHAVDMLTNNYFSHDSQDGTSPFDRMTAAGYKWSGAAENIAAGQRTPADVMTAWMNSSGHRANILNCGLKDIGVGYAAGSGADYGQYWVQDFGSPA